MEHFTPLASTLGGLLIGLAAALLLLTNGRIAGVSGIAGGLLTESTTRERGWRAMFVAGLLIGGLVSGLVAPTSITAADASTATLIAAGLLVGLGTRLGSGCTSGHGVCGLSRLSPRSMIATATFMAAGAITVLIARHFIGGAS